MTSLLIDVARLTEDDLRGLGVFATMGTIKELRAWLEKKADQHAALLSSLKAPDTARQDVRDAITELGPTGVYDKHYEAVFPKVKDEHDAHEVACFAVFLAGMGAERAQQKATTNEVSTEVSVSSSAPREADPLREAAQWFYDNVKLVPHKDAEAKWWCGVVSAVNVEELIAARMKVWRAMQATDRG